MSFSLAQILQPLFELPSLTLGVACKVRWVKHNQIQSFHCVDHFFLQLLVEAHAHHLWIVDSLEKMVMLYAA
jgi:hypothetical protein